MAANVLNSDVAIDASIMIVRVFVRLKELAQEHSDLRTRLQMLEQRVARGFSEHSEELQRENRSINTARYMKPSFVQI